MSHFSEPAQPDSPSMSSPTPNTLPSDVDSFAFAVHLLHTNRYISPKFLDCGLLLTEIEKVWELHKKFLVEHETILEIVDDIMEDVRAGNAILKDKGEYIEIPPLSNGNSPTKSKKKRAKGKRKANAKKKTRTPRAWKDAQS